MVFFIPGEDQWDFSIIDQKYFHFSDIIGHAKGEPSNENVQS